MIRADRLARRHRRFVLEWSLTAVIGLAVLCGLAATGATTPVDHLVYDAILRASPAKASDDIIIIAIDDDSLQAIGPWPWPREVHARLLERLAQARPRATFYDVLFAEPAADPAQDARLAQAMRAAGPVYLPLLVDRIGRNGAPINILPPTPTLAAAAAGLGRVDLYFDRDGSVRRVRLDDGSGRRQLAALAAAHLAPRGAPAREPRTALPPYAGPAGSFRTVPFVSVLNGETPPDFLRDKMILVGATAPGLHDRYATPLSGAGGMPGVEIQANLIQALAAGAVIRPLPPGVGFSISFAAVAAVLAGCLRLSPRGALALTLGVAALVLAISLGLMAAARLWFAPAAALVAVAVIYPLWSWRRLEAAGAYMFEELERFGRDPDILGPGIAPSPSSDPLSRQLDLMDQAVGRMRDLRRFSADALNELPDPTLILSADGRVILANRRAEALFGRAGPVVDSAWTELTADWRAAEAGADSRLLSQGPGAFAGDAPDDLEAVAPDQRVFRIKSVQHHLAHSGGDCWIVRLSDITAEREAAEQRDRIRQLLTHDMRSPQAAILALIEQAAPGELAPRLAQRFAGYARRTLGLAESFVQLARAQSDAFSPQPLNLPDVLVEAADEVWPLASQAGISVEVEAGDEEAWIDGDRELLTRALVNLIGNAVKYSPAGAQVLCRLTRHDGEALCQIIDQGRGMTADELQRLFSPFQRLGDAAERRRTGGVGLGLAMVQAVVRRHGGRIRCDSELGRGSTFTVSLPISEEGAG